MSSNRFDRRGEGCGGDSAQQGTAKDRFQASGQCQPYTELPSCGEMTVGSSPLPTFSLEDPLSSSVTWGQDLTVGVTGRTVERNALER